MKVKIIAAIILTQILLVAFQDRTYAKVSLPKIFSSNMVLQQGQNNPVWGWANKGEKITVSISGKSVKTKAGADGKWKVEIPALDYGGPHTLTVKGENLIELKNVMIGEVWLCSGQSNMGWQLKLCTNGDKEVADANYPLIRIFSVERKLSQFPDDDIASGEWQECSPQTIRSFSGVAYFFGREIHKKLNVPVGLIQSSWGGTLIEGWMSGESLKEDPDFKGPLSDLEKADLKKILKEKEASVLKRMGGELPSDTDSNKYLSQYSSVDYIDSNWDNVSVDKRWEANGYINIDGVAWYRKTINLSEAQSKTSFKLYLGKIDESDKVWINGHFIGATKNDNQAERIYTVPKETLKSGKNILLVQVEDTKDSGGLLGCVGGQRLDNAEWNIDLSNDWKIKFALAKLKPIVTNHYDYPTMMYKGMIHPLKPFGIKGIIWYQGESNVSRAKQYQRLFPNLITDWRKQWGQGNFPFLFVSIAGYQVPAENPGESDWAELREAQTAALKLPNTGMAVAIDIGEPSGVHPPNKQDVGSRLALNALKIAYKKEVVCSSPLFSSMQRTGSNVNIEFNNGGSALMVKNRYGYINGFAVAGTDKKFYWAKAELVNDHTVKVYSPNVENPVAVRFGWADNPGEWNLYNKEGLPAHPFRTDSWSREEK